MQKLVAGRNAWSDASRYLRGRRKVMAAIAFVTTAEVLPLRRGDLAIVNAETATIAAGGTDPSAIGTWLERGVDVRSCASLHAKVVLADGIAVVGSANASRSSLELLHEAMIITDSVRVRSDLKTFLEDLADISTQLDADWVERMSPMFGTARVRHTTRLRHGSVLPQNIDRLQVVWTQTDPSDVPIEVSKAVRNATRRARRRGQPPKFVHEWYEWGTTSDDREGDLLCQAVEDGEDVQIDAPQRVVGVLKPHRRRKRWLVLRTDSALESVGKERLFASARLDGGAVIFDKWIYERDTIARILKVWGMDLDAR